MNEYLQLFKLHLFSQKHPAVTVKNYLSDVSRFIRWFELSLQKPFNPQIITQLILNQYQSASSSTLSTRSIERHIASLRKFFSLLKEQNIINKHPFEISSNVPEITRNNLELGNLRAFKDFLYQKNCSSVTIQNYLIDLKQFLEWLKKVTANKTASYNQDNIFKAIDTALIIEYKSRLLSESGLSPISINRKLSSLRKYLNWLYSIGLIGKTQTINLNAITNLNNDIPKQSDVFDSLQEKQPVSGNYFAPIRLIRQTKYGINYIFDQCIIIPLAKSVEQIQYAYFKIRQKTIFRSFLPKKISKFQAAPMLDTLIVHGMAQRKQEINVRTGLTTFHNISKLFYAPLAVSTIDMSFAQKIRHYLLHKRPIWYKKYHEYPIVHYLHFALLIFFIIALWTWIEDSYIQKPQQEQTVLAVTSTALPRILSFKGMLTDQNNLPVSAISTLRFSLYNDQIATGSALLWQEVLSVTPDQQGNFQAALGQQMSIPQQIFTDNPDIYLGITKDGEPEMHPRQQLATTGLAKDSQSLQGLKPITISSQSTNTLLALDSAGNLSIGGDNGPLFQATEGNFRLSGQALILSTNSGSNGNIVLAPDGIGSIDLQKPLQNTTGSVEIADAFSISATSSAMAALAIDQQSNGLIISASGSGTAKFTLDFLGNTMIGGDLAINGSNLTTTQNSFNLFPDNTINLNIGNSATDIRLGSNTGNTTIRNNLTVNGNVIFNGRLSSDLLVTDNSKFNLGSANSALNNAYFTNLFLSPSATTSGFLRRDGGNLSPVNQNDSLLLGGITYSSALVKLSGTVGGDSFFNAGKVGIATTSALSDTLQVYGDVRIGTATSDGCLKRADGTALVGACSSDIRLKKDIKPINNILDKLTNLQAVTFRMRSDEFPGYAFGNQISYGLIAQQVEELFPDLVSSDANGYKTVNYGPELTMLNLEGLRELSNQFSALKKLMANNIIDSSGDIYIIKDESNTYLATANDGTIITKIDAFATVFAAKLEAGLISAKEGFFDSLAISSDKITIAGVNLRDYVINVIEKSTINNQTSITSPLVSTNRLQTDFISPLSDKSDIALKFDNSQLSILNSQLSTASAVASFDRYGNATFSGTLRAGKIIADQIDGLDDRLATLSAIASNSANQIVTNIYNTYNTASNSAVQNEQTSSPSAQVTLDSSLGLRSPDSIGTKEAVPSVPSVPSALATSFAPLGSSSAALAYVPNLNSDFQTITQGLMVFGDTSLSDLSVADQIAVGGNMILADNSINVLGASFELQPLKQGIISMMAGLVSIDTEGNLSVSGNANFGKNVTINGTLAVGIIAPVPGSDLIVQLPGSNEINQQTVVNNAYNALQNATDNSKFVIKNASGSAVLSVNHLGDLIASGTAAFNNIAAGSLNIVRGASADTSAIDTVASGSAGLATITAGYTSRTIYSPYIKENSLIYISPNSETANSVPYLARQTVSSFTVQIPTAISEDTSFNWWIIN
jgi:site-specific recombinase XerD